VIALALLALILAVAAALSGALNVIQRRRLAEARRDLAEARLDPVTGLATRRLWDARATEALGSPNGLVMVVVDADGTKKVNDQHGHPVGDVLIRAHAQRLQAWTENRGLVGRLGGDEFAVFLRPRSDADLAEELDALCAALSRPIVVNDVVLQTGASVGAVRVAELPVRDLYQAKKAADVALYQAKNAGGRTWRVAERRTEPFAVDRAPQLRVRELETAG